MATPAAAQDTGSSLGLAVSIGQIDGLGIGFDGILEKTVDDVTLLKAETASDAGALGMAHLIASTVSNLSTGSRHGVDRPIDPKNWQLGDRTRTPFSGPRTQGPESVPILYASYL